MSVAEAEEFFGDGEAASPGRAQDPRAARRRRARLPQPRPAAHHALGRRAPAAQAGDPHGREGRRLRPRRADHRPAPRRRRAAARPARPARRLGQVGHRHRAPPGGDGARRLDHRPRPRRRPRRRPDRLRGHARRPRRRPLRRSPASTSRPTSAKSPPRTPGRGSTRKCPRRSRGQWIRARAEDVARVIPGRRGPFRVPCASPADREGGEGSDQGEGEEDGEGDQGDAADDLEHVPRVVERVAEAPAAVVARRRLVGGHVDPDGREPALALDPVERRLLRRWRSPSARRCAA